MDLSSRLFPRLEIRNSHRHHTHRQQQPLRSGNRCSYNTLWNWISSGAGNGNRPVTGSASNAFTGQTWSANQKIFPAKKGISAHCRRGPIRLSWNRAWSTACQSRWDTQALARLLINYHRSRTTCD